MIPNQTIIDNLSAQDIIDTPKKELETLEAERKDQIRMGFR